MPYGHRARRSIECAIGWQRPAGDPELLTPNLFHLCQERALRVRVECFHSNLQQFDPVVPLADRVFRFSQCCDEFSVGDGLQFRM